jgi:hypothetical protein
VSGTGSVQANRRPDIAFSSLLRPIPRTVRNNIFIVFLFFFDCWNRACERKIHFGRLSASIEQNPLFICKAWEKKRNVAQCSTLMCCGHRTAPSHIPSLLVIYLFPKILSPNYNAHNLNTNKQIRERLKKRWFKKPFLKCSLLKVVDLDALLAGKQHSYGVLLDHQSGDEAESNGSS